MVQTRSTTRHSTTRRIADFPADQPILTFAGAFRFLSNFSPSPIEIPVALVGDELRAAAQAVRNNIPIGAPTVEHAFQALKCRSLDWYVEIMLASSATRARQIGKRILPKDQVRADWDAVRVDVMRCLVRLKFATVSPLHDELRARLLATGERELVEGNTWGDYFWGAVPRGAAFPASRAYPVAAVHAGSATVYDGHNWLGQILMERRSAIRAGLRAAQHAGGK